MLSPARRSGPGRLGRFTLLLELSLSASSNRLSHLFDPTTQFLYVAPDAVLRRGSLVLHPVLPLFDPAANEATRRSAGAWGKQDRQGDTRSQPGQEKQ